MRRRTRLMLLLGYGWLAAGCATAQGAKPWSEIYFVSDNGQAKFKEAAQQYQLLRIVGVDGPNSRARMRETVVGPLQTAIANDRTNPLFHAKLAETLLEIDTDPATVEEARRAYSDALALGTQDWVPAHLGRINIALYLGNTPDIPQAHAALKDARLALESLERGYGRALKPSEPIRILWLTIPVGDGGKRVGANPTQKEKAQLLVAWVHAHFAWSPENGSVLDDEKGIDTTTAEAMNRLKAAVGLAELEIEFAANPGAETAKKALDQFEKKVESFDRNYYPAKEFKAYLLGVVGDYVSAEAMLEPLVTSTGNFRLRNNPKIVTTLANVRVLRLRHDETLVGEPRQKLFFSTEMLLRSRFGWDLKNGSDSSLIRELKVHRPPYKPALDALAELYFASANDLGVEVARERLTELAEHVANGNDGSLIDGATPEDIATLRRRIDALGSPAPTAP